MYIWSIVLWRVKFYKSHLNNVYFLFLTSKKTNYSNFLNCSFKWSLWIVLFWKPNGTYELKVKSKQVGTHCYHCDIKGKIKWVDTCQDQLTANANAAAVKLVFYCKQYAFGVMFRQSAKSTRRRSCWTRLTVPLGTVFVWAGGRGGPAAR